MKRLHVHVAVDDLVRSIGFYSALFDAKPSILKHDYAKWMLDDPKVNFAISSRGAAEGLDHLGIQVETADELAEIYGRLRQADRPVLEEGATTCCYAQSEKSWIADPQGLSWETFLTTGESTVYGDSADLGPIRTAARPTGRTTARTPSEACCAPQTPQTPKGACCAQGAAP